MKCYRHLPIFLLVTFLMMAACSKKHDTTEISAEEAIRIAVTIANQEKFNTNNADIEVLKFGKGVERGPIRALSFVRYLAKDRYKAIVKSEFWIVFFYPKGELEQPNTLGGDYTVLVDLHSGKVIEYFAGR